MTPPGAGDPMNATATLRHLTRLARRAALPLGVAMLLAATPAWAGEAATLTGAQVGTAENVTVIALQFASTGGNPAVSAFRQTNPERLVFDIANATLASGATAPSGGLVTRSEFSTFNDGSSNVRLTVYLSESATWEARSEGATVVLTLKAGQVADPLGSALGQTTNTPSATGTPTGLDVVDGVKLSGPDTSPAPTASLNTLDFQQKDRVSRVIIGVQGSSPEISQPEKNLITVDIPGGFVPESLRRELDTKFFYSAVDSVRAYPTRTGGRVAVRLREGAEYSVKKENGLTYLDVTIPASLQAQRDAAVSESASAAPSTPSTSGGEGLSNASGTEVLIDEKGRALDPQAMYGAGQGSRRGTLPFATQASGNYHYTGRRMSIDLQEADIHTVFRFIADFGEVNIVTSDDVKGTVTIRLKDVPWDEALAAVLQAKGLGAQQMGDIIRVAPIETIKSEQQAALEASKAHSDLEPLQVYVAPLNYASAEEVADQIASMLSERGKIEVDVRGNQLIIRDKAGEVAQIRELLKRMDRPNRQVSIEARFVEASSSFSRSLGIQWGTSVDASAATGYPTGWLFPNSIGIGGGIVPRVGTTGGNSGTPGGASFYTPDSQSLLVDLGANNPVGSIAFALGSIPGLIDVDARLSAVAREGRAKIVSSPRVTALDNEEAVVSQGSRIPYQSASQNGTNVQFIQAVLELRVTPHITSDNMIFLDIEIANDRPDFSIQVQGNPGISTKSIQTKVMVADGDTTVLGGVYATTEQYAEARVPGLGNLPLIGYLFKATDKSRTQNEMLVFITPRVVPVDEGGTVSSK